MHKKRAEKLIAALESGKYLKGKDALHRICKINSKGEVLANEIDMPVKNCCKNTTHCCLGVAECIMPKSARGEESIRTGLTNSERYTAIRKWLEINEGQMQTLINKNDYSDTFEPIIVKLREMMQ